MLHLYMHILDNGKQESAENEVIKQSHITGMLNWNMLIYGKGQKFGQQKYIFTKRAKCNKNTA